MANQSIKEAFERFWHHVIVKLSDYATVESLNAHVDDKSNPHNVNLTQFEITASAEDINQISGATSNIQEQIDALANRSDLPEISESDNGAFLRVVNGEWNISVVPDAEEVSF